MKGARPRGERVYSTLLRLYPRDFQSHYGEALLEVFRYKRDLRINGNAALGIGFWSFIIKDLLTSAWREWRRPLQSSRTSRAATTSGGEGMRGWIDDLAHAGRRLLRSPGFTATALTILVLGIGVNSSTFSVVNALLLQPPPFQDPEQVVTVLQDSDGGEPSSTSYPAYLDIARTPDVFANVSAYYSTQAFIQQGDAITPVLVEYATAAYLDVIGLSPSRGNWFDLEADDPSGPPAAVITHAMWADRMGADPDILGRTIRIGGGAVTVVGVGPVEFNGGAGPGAVDMWLSISAMAVTGGRVASLGRRQDHPFTVRARLAPGVSIERASSSMDRLANELATTFPQLNAGRGIHVLSVLTNRISPEVDAQLVPAAAFAMSVVVLALIIGTLNLANLFLVRSAARAPELAVRLALGASRARIIRVVAAEALLLSALGGAGGLASAEIIARWMRNIRLDFGLPVLIDVRLDGRVVLFTLLVSLSVGLLFGLLPALRATRRDVSASLRDDATNALGARRRFGVTGALVAGQVAVSVILLAIAGLFLDSLIRADGADPGFSWENTAYIQVNAGPLELGDEATILLLDQIEERMQALPGIGRVTRSIMLPAAQLGTTTLLLGAGIDGVDAPTEIPWNYVSLDYFEVLEMPLLHGRLFRDADLTGPTVAVVSAALARTYWGRTDVVGETYRSEGSPETLREIVGVVGDATVRALGEPPTPSIYWPLNFVLARQSFIFEVEGTAGEALAAARAAVSEIDSRIMLLEAGTMGEHLGQTLQRQRLAGTLLGGLGLMALMLAVLGIYGVVSFGVSRRRHEIGVRVALGAGRESVVRLFVRDVSGVVLAGAIVGLLLSIPLGTLVGRLFTGGEGSPFTTVGVAVLLLLTSLVATVIPAARAARTDPTQALRRE